MPGIRIAVIELAAVDQYLGHALADHHAAQRQVTGGDPFGECHQIGLEAERLAAEPPASAAKTTDHFIGYQQHTIVATDTLHFRPIGRGRNDDAAGALDRLADEGRNVFGANFENFLLQPTRCAQTEGCRILGAAEPVPVGRIDMYDTGDRKPTLGMHAGHATQACARHGAAVVAAPAADDRLALGLPEHVPVTAHHAHDSVVRFRAGTGEEHMVELRRGDFCQQTGQGQCRGIGRLEETVVVRQFLHLRRGRVDQLAASIADIHAPEARHAIEDFLSLGIPQPYAIGAGDDAGTEFMQRLGIREGMQVVPAIDRLPLRRGVSIGQRHTLRSRNSRSQELMTWKNVAYSFCLTAA